MPDVRTACSFVFKRLGGVGAGLILGLLSILVSAPAAVAQDANGSLPTLQWTQQTLVVASNDADYRSQANSLLAPLAQANGSGLSRTLAAVSLEALKPATLGDGLAVLVLHAPGESGPQLMARLNTLVQSMQAKHLVAFVDGDATGWIYQEAAQHSALDLYALARSADERADRAALFEQLRRGLFGYADRLPFGNDDKNLANTELLAFVYRSMARRLGDGLASQDMNSGRALSLLDLDDQARASVDDEVALQGELLEAQGLLTREGDLAAIQSYFDRCIFCPLAGELTSSQRKLIEDEAQAQAEQSYFDRLKESRNAAGLRTLLAACQVCSFQQEALALLDALETQEARQADTAAYEAAKTLDALDRYLQTCQVCEFKQEALERIQDLSQQADERLTFFTARKTNTLPALDAYLKSCQVCEFTDEAKAMSELILTSPSALAERDSWLDAKEQQDLTLARDYLEGCSVCQFSQEAQQLERSIRDAQDEASIARPCLSLAAASQYGGLPLGKIDRSDAIPACRKAVERFPGRADLATALGRALMLNAAYSEAKSLFEAAAASEGQGAAAAAGMAAYISYFDLPGLSPDLAASQRYAEQGQAAGDHTATLIWSFLVEQKRIQADGEALTAALEAIADQGSALGQYLLARRLQSTSSAGDEAAQQRIIDLLTSAADQGQLDAQALLARRLEAGDSPAGKQGRRAARLYFDAYLAGGTEARIALVDEGRERSIEVMRLVQRDLARQGYYDLALDGKYGLNTQRGLERALQDRVFTER